MNRLCQLPQRRGLMFSPFLKFMIADLATPDWRERCLKSGDTKPQKARLRNYQSAKTFGEPYRRLNPTEAEIRVALR